MTPNTESPTETQETIAAIARLLHHAADRTTELAATEGPRSALHVLSFGIHLAAAEADLLVPPQLDPYLPHPIQDDPVELLRAAEQLARTVPVDATTPGLSVVVDTIADLLHQAAS